MDFLCRELRFAPDTPSGDISLIGCDDSPQAEYFCPPLTVIDIPNSRLGETAAAWIHHKIEGSAAPHPPKEPWMEGHLIVRESTAPPGPDTRPKV